MNPQNKNIALSIVAVLIIGTIIYIEWNKPAMLAPGSAQNIALTADDVSNATSTATTTGAVGEFGDAAPSAVNMDRIKAKAGKYPSAVEIIPGPESGATGAAATGFINSDPFTLKSLVGNKVVLLDFWTYSCINCQRTIPYLNAWYQKYKDYGLVIVGVHTPEFDFEKNYANVAAAVKADNIQYPVVQDNNMSTWQAYQNEYWPHEYLIDIDGYIVHDKIGEGDYADTEAAIQAALQERADVLHTGQTIPTGTVDPSNVVSVDTNQSISPETYFGSNRNEYAGNATSGVAGTKTLVLPAASAMQQDMFYLDGVWNFQPEYAEATQSNAKIVYDFQAKNLYFVAAADTAVAPNGVKVKILIDGQPISAAQAGTDVAANGTATIKANTLYNLFKGSDYSEHTIEIDVMDAGLQAYTFTFG